jgi:hypothetical protein
VADDLDHFRYELAARVGEKVWVEKIKPRQVDEAEEQVPTVSGDAASELRATLAELRADPEALRAVFSAGECSKLRKALLNEHRTMLDGKDCDEIIEMAAVFLGGGPMEEDE